MPTATEPKAAAFLALASLAGLAGHAASAQETVKSSRINPPEAGLNAPYWTPERPPDPRRTLRFSSLPNRLGAARIQLANADYVIDTADWRAVAISEQSLSDFCTLTLVGPRVALLAAHCVDAGLEPGTPGNHALPITVRFGQASYPMTCEIPTEYSDRGINLMGAPRSSEDFALCDVDPGVADVRGVDAEVISTAVPMSPNGRLQLMGYGCTNLGLSDDFRYTYDPGDGKLRMGVEQVEAVGISLYPDRPGIYLRTESSGREPVLCFGDSGGPVIVASGTGSGRRVIAVNSGVGATLAATPAAPAFYSYLSPLNSQAFVGFLDRWVSQPGVAAARRRPRIVCGYNRSPGIGGCRL